MSHRSFASTTALVVVVLVGLLVQAPVAGQTPSSANKATTAGKAWTPTASRICKEYGPIIR